MDDDQILLELTAAVLRSVPGSEVVVCVDARAALGIFFADPESFELVVTDFNMPGMDGIELVRAVPKPGVPGALLATMRSVLAPPRRSWRQNLLV